MVANKSKAKGTRAELVLRDILRESTGLEWERTPGSGAMHSRYKMKGDLFIPNSNNQYLIECKHYKDDSLSSKILVNKEPNLIVWWNKAQEQGTDTGMHPLVIYKWDRSKWFVVTHRLLNITPGLTLDTGTGIKGHIYPLTKFLEEDTIWVQ